LGSLRVVVLTGPTGAGKTELAMSLAAGLGGEIVSGDSMQIYKGIPIATAQPTQAQMEKIPHHLIGFLPTDKSYSVAEYVFDARRVLRQIASRGKLPVVVGGTGLYISSLIDGRAFSQNSSDAEVRKRLAGEAGLYGNLYMHRRLELIDPEYAAGLHPNNLGRILRAMEHYECTGITMTQQNKLSHEQPSDILPVMLGLDFRDRKKLYRRIEQRIDQMLKEGLVDEARQFYAESGAGTAAQAIGHKELLPYLKDELGLEVCVEQLKQKTRQYAKRQLTWFRRDERISWYYADDYKSADEMAHKVLRAAKNQLGIKPE
jgi:tRNA dimethylallyltransferase